MALRDQTKKIFADEMEYMLRTTPLEDIRVVELCKRCGATPPAFYYHFRDKYELAAWIFLRDFVEIFAGRTFHYTDAELSAAAKQLTRRRSFYQNAWGNKTPEPILNYVRYFNLRLDIDAVRRYLGIEELSKDQLHLLSYHNYGFLGMLEEWLEEESELSLSELARFQYETAPDFLKEALKDYPYLSTDIMHRLGK